MKSLLKFFFCITILSLSIGCSSDSDDMKDDNNPVCTSTKDNIVQSEQFISITKADYENDKSNSSKCTEYRNALIVLVSNINFLNNAECDGSAYDDRLVEVKALIEDLDCN